MTMFEFVALFALFSALIALAAGRLWPCLFGHSYALKTSAPSSFDDDGEVKSWIRSDYDLYRVCRKCGHSYGVGNRYE